MADTAYLVAVLMFAGCCSGFMAGFFGIGGGVVIVPTLFFVFQYLGVPSATSMAMAVSTSLAIIVPTAISSARAHHKLGNLDWGIVKIWALPMVLGVIIGTQSIVNVKGGLLTLVFGLTLWFVAWSLLFGKKAGLEFKQKPSKIVQAMISSVIGCIAVMAGIGGGALSSPVIMAMKVNAHRAIGTASSFGLLIAAPGAIAILLNGTTPEYPPWGTYSLINFPAFAIMSIMAILMSPIGAKANSKISEKLLKRLFAAFLLVMGARMLTTLIF